MSEAWELAGGGVRINWGREVFMIELASVRIDRIDTAVVVRLAGEIDLSNADMIGRGMANVFTAGLPVIVDCSDLSYTDSAGVRLLESAVAEAAAAGVPIRFTVPRTSPVRPMLMMTGLAMRCPTDVDLDSSLRNAHPDGPTCLPWTGSGGGSHDRRSSRPCLPGAGLIMF